MQNLFEDSFWVIRYLPISNWSVQVAQKPYSVLMVIFLKMSMSSIISTDYILLPVIFHLALLTLQNPPAKYRYQQTLKTKID